MKMNATWGTVQDDPFTLEDGNVVCRAVGYGSAKAVKMGAAYGRGIGLVHYSDVQ